MAVIVLNWNGRDDTIACVESVEALDYPSFRLLVVDNGSSDGSVAALHQRFPHLDVLETGRNLGFAGGNNVGMQLALERGADYVFLLNNDTIVHPGLLGELVAAAERCPDGGIFMAKIFYHAEPARVWCAGVRWIPDAMEFRHVQDESQVAIDARGVAETDYACGCALLARATTLRKIGLLDPKFFLTYEETDLCYRARRAGYACYYVPAAVLWHKISVSFGGAESPLVKYFLVRNRLLWAERYLPVKQLLHLYKITWWELSVRLGGRCGLQLNNGQCSLRAFWSRWKDPVTQAVLLGALHYFIRRFGDAPRYVRKLAGVRA